MTASGPAEVYVCIVCAAEETDLDLFATCDGCGDLYHYNPRMTPGKDCGEAWIEDEEIGIQYYCNRCMATARREDEDRMEQLKQLVNSGTATPDTVAALMQSLSGALASPPPAADGPYAGFPGLQPGMPGAPAMPPGGGFPGMPGFAGTPAPIVLDPRDMPGAVAGTVAGEGDVSSPRPSGAEPPPLRARRARGGGPRRYRRIDE